MLIHVIPSLTLARCEPFLSWLLLFLSLFKTHNLFCFIRFLWCTWLCSICDTLNVLWNDYNLPSHVLFLLVCLALLFFLRSLALGVQLKLSSVNFLHASWQIQLYSLCLSTCVSVPSFSRQVSNFNQLPLDCPFFLGKGVGRQQTHLVAGIENSESSNPKHSWWSTIKFD